MFRLRINFCNYTNYGTTLASWAQLKATTFVKKQQLLCQNIIKTLSLQAKRSADYHPSLFQFDLQYFIALALASTRYSSSP
jgi:hypothetical protein